MTLIITVMSPFTQWIISFVITPDYFNNVIEFSVSSGYFDTVEEARQQFNYKTYVIQSTIWSLIMGILTTIIVTIFIKSKPSSS